MEPLFALTFDLDWAPDEVVAYAVQPALEAGIPVTLFATHRSPYVLSLLEAHPNLVEVGLHPNYNPYFLNQGQADWRGLLRELRGHYPGAVGVRAHSHVVSSHLLAHYQEEGFRYESGIYADNASGLVPLPYDRGFTRLPHFFQDDAHLLRDRPFALSALELASPGLKIFDFHPVHVFLNTQSLQHYEESKRHYQDPAGLASCRGRGPGVGELYGHVLEYLKARPGRTLRLADVVLGD